MLNRLFRQMLPVKKKPVEKRKEMSCDELSRILCFEGVPKAKESVRNQGMGSTLGGAFDGVMEKVVIMREVMRV